MMHVEAMLALAAEVPLDAEESRGKHWKMDFIYVITAVITSVHVPLGHCQKQDCDLGWLSRSESTFNIALLTLTPVEVLWTNW